MLVEERQLGSAVNIRTTNEITYRKGQMLMDGCGFGDVIDAKTFAAEAQPEVRILRNSKLGIEGAASRTASRATLKLQVTK